MAKDLKGGLNAVLSGTGKKAPKSETAATDKLSTSSGLAQEYDRETFIVRRDLMEDVRAIAHWDRLYLKEAVEKAFEKYVEAYIKKHGSLEPRPAEVIAREQMRSKSGRKPGSSNK